jgi:hypothetical protein
VQADFVKVTRQVAPAVHRFARAARVNDVAHGGKMKRSRARRNSKIKTLEFENAALQALFKSL